MTTLSSPTPDRLLTGNHIPYRVVYSLKQVRRLAAQGRFPKPLQLSKARIAWSQNDLTLWMQRLADKRRNAPITLSHDDRFISAKELKTLVPYSSTHLQRLEAANLFPARITIGQKRVAWLEREIFEWIATKRPTSPQPLVTTDVNPTPSRNATQELL